MRPVITAETSARLDAASHDPVETLMDRAGMATALAAVRMGAGYGTRVAVLAGPGNNGGDGYVAAAYLAERGASVRVFALADPATPASRQAADRARASGALVKSWTDQPWHADLIIDALFGGGFHGTLPEGVTPWLSHPAPVLSVDVPSGLSADTGTGEAFAADVTVTFHAAKVGHFAGDGPAAVGALEVADIGLEGGDPAFLICEDQDARRPVRRWDSHKWSVGSVMVVGGSTGMTGAAALAGRAALRYGAGAVSVATSAATQATYAGLAPELLTTGVSAGETFQPDDAGRLIEAAERYDVLVIGPGLGAVAPEFVLGVLRARTGRLLVDADGLNALQGIEPLAERDGETIITPHAGEFLRLTGRPASYQAAARLAAETSAVVVLKGWPTFVAGDGPVVAVTSGGPELATIGTGDVLAGMIAAGWAGGLSGSVAAYSAAHWHGRTGKATATGSVLTADRLLANVGTL